MIWPNCVFFKLIEEIELQKSCHVITITSPKNVTKITSQFFSNLLLSQSKFLATPVRKRYTVPQLLIRILFKLITLIHSAPNVGAFHPNLHCKLNLA